MWSITCCRPTPLCELPPVPGNCLALFPRWFYSVKGQKCQQFIFGQFLAALPGAAACLVFPVDALPERLPRPGGTRCQMPALLSTTSSFFAQEGAAAMPTTSRQPMTAWQPACESTCPSGRWCILLPGLPDAGTPSWHACGMVAVTLVSWPLLPADGPFLSRQQTRHSHAWCPRSLGCADPSLPAPCPRSQAPARPTSHAGSTTARPKNALNLSTVSFRCMAQAPAGQWERQAGQEQQGRQQGQEPPHPPPPPHPHPPRVTAAHSGRLACRHPVSAVRAGGCGGNKNNFLTLAACNAVCK